jgi:hypothetical protein
VNVEQTNLGRTLVATTLLVAGWLGAARDAHATLGGDVASVVSNAERLGGARQVEKVRVGERHEIVLPSGIVVHEYLSPAGAVYAITWRGPRMPNLRELLGPHFGELSSKDPRTGLHRLNVTLPDLVIRSSGHARTFVGVAWAPALVPPDVNPGTDLD